MAATTKTTTKAMSSTTTTTTRRRRRASQKQSTQHHATSSAATAASAAAVTTTTRARATTWQHRVTAALLAVAALLDAAVAQSALPLMCEHKTHIPIASAAALTYYQLLYVLPQLCTTRVAEVVAQRAGAAVTLVASLAASALCVYVLSQSLRHQSVTLYFVARLLSGVLRHDKLLFELANAATVVADNNNNKYARRTRHDHSSNNNGKNNNDKSKHTHTRVVLVAATTLRACTLVGSVAGLVAAGVAGDWLGDVAAITRGFAMLEVLAATAVLLSSTTMTTTTTTPLVVAPYMRWLRQEVLWRPTLLHTSPAQATTTVATAHDNDNDDDDDSVRVHDAAAKRQRRRRSLQPSQQQQPQPQQQQQRHDDDHSAVTAVAARVHKRATRRRHAAASSSSTSSPLSWHAYALLYACVMVASSVHQCVYALKPLELHTSYTWTGMHLSLVLLLQSVVVPQMVLPRLMARRVADAALSLCALWLLCGTLLQPRVERATTAMASASWWRSHTAAAAVFYALSFVCVDAPAALLSSLIAEQATRRVGEATRRLHVRKLLVHVTQLARLFSAPLRIVVRARLQYATSSPLDVVSAPLTLVVYATHVLASASRSRRAVMATSVATLLVSMLLMPAWQSRLRATLGGRASAHVS